MSSTQGLDLVGQILGNKYLIGKELGKGAMGAVYLATHIEASRPVPVILKVAHPWYMGNTEFVERFEQEAKADVNIKDSNGNTALIEAIRNNQPEIVNLLLKAKADVPIHNYLGKNATTYAKETNQEEFLSLLESTQ